MLIDGDIGPTQLVDLSDPVQVQMFPPPTGVTVTPDLTQPDSVTLTCSVDFVPTDDYHYQWKWWKNGMALSSHTDLLQSVYK